jgi:hypothetical protein
VDGGGMLPSEVLPLSRRLRPGHRPDGQ